MGPLPGAACHRGAAVPLAHPRVSTVLLGSRSVPEFQADLGWLDVPVPGEPWDELQRVGLLRDDAPVSGKRDRRWRQVLGRRGK
jgi:hypothetical protein